MAVPDTTTFELQDVIDVVNPTSDDLTDCFADAVSNKFNATYKAQYYAAAGDKNNLLMFRDYDAGVSNLLVVGTAANGFPPVSHNTVSNESVNNQVITYTYTFVGQSGDLDATVYYGGTGYPGTARAAGYTTPTLSGNISDYAFDPPFLILGGNATTLTFKFTLLTAAVDTVPSSPNNSSSVTRCQYCD
mgnify:CR=1 FL=1